MQYKGFSTIMEYCSQDWIFYGKILNIRHLVLFGSEKAEDFESEFHLAVDDYIETQKCIDEHKM